MQHNKSGHFPLSNLIKADVQIVTVLLNKSPSKCFSANSSLNFMDMKFKWRCVVYWARV